MADRAIPHVRAIIGGIIVDARSTVEIRKQNSFPFFPGWAFSGDSFQKCVAAVRDCAEFNCTGDFYFDPGVQSRI